MCGIGGFIDNTLTFEQAGKVIREMLHEVNHRGPDCSDAWIEAPVALGHNRLSIIDLSETANQPMTFNKLKITYNGELYNYLEIKAELEILGFNFTTNSDTEVVLAAYSHWKENCVKKFMGMWSFAIWDQVNEVLFCSRDRFGIKPFHYIFDNGNFYFSSEIKALKKSRLFNGNINSSQVFRFLQLGWAVYQDQSFFDNIHSLPESSNLIYKEGKIEITTYWDVSQNVLSLPETFEERSGKFREMFFDSVKLHYRSDVEIGTCLSGGLDSSSIISVAATLFPQKEIKAFNIFYEGKGDVDERPYVEEIVRKFENIDPYYYSPGGDEIANELDNIIFYADTPLASSSYVSQYFVMKLASKYKIKVLLDGQGSDEYLAGYMHTFNRLLGYFINKNNYLSVINNLFYHKREHDISLKQIPMLLMKSVYAAFNSENDIFNYEVRRLNPILHEKSTKNNPVIELEKHCNDKMNNFFYHLMFNTSLPTLLHYEDRNSMAFSIESRVPFLDHRLVEYGFALPLADKINKGETKFILRHSLKGILPESVRKRKDKKGFVTPGESKWLRGSLRHLLKEDLSNIEPWVNLHSVKRIVDSYKRGNNTNAKLVWRIIMFSKWLKMQ
jgi:asparagine synthase (glutamine-hydrolysing)